MPSTGVTRTYEFSISYGVIAPDGVQKNGLLVNNQFPGPLIEANWGDWIQVTVTNNLPADSVDQGEGTALHWHGFVQHETPYYDGVPSVQQCPIAPSKSLVSSSPFLLYISLFFIKVLYYSSWLFRPT
jgi:FtsP/CotA-like multicopper oxidase with cupredoxin domain